MVGFKQFKYYSHFALDIFNAKQFFRQKLLKNLMMNLQNP
jgi:hypothetical protein